jgi:membrane-bound lytic murein transglycosylase MltF
MTTTPQTPVPVTDTIGCTISIWPKTDKIHAWVNSVSAASGDVLGHVEFGDLDISVRSSADAAAIADVFAELATQLALVEAGTWEK